jgi:hypothetical protein
MDHFNCPECGRSVEAPARGSPVRIECPHCHEIVLVPHARRGERSPGDPHRATERCADPADSGLLLWLNDGLRTTSLSTTAGDRDTPRGGESPEPAGLPVLSRHPR